MWMICEFYIVFAFFQIYRSFPIIQSPLIFDLIVWTEFYLGYKTFCKPFHPFGLMYACRNVTITWIFWCRCCFFYKNNKTNTWENMFGIYEKWNSLPLNDSERSKSSDKRSTSMILNIKITYFYIYSRHITILKKPVIKHTNRKENRYKTNCWRLSLETIWFR